MEGNLGDTEAGRPTRSKLLGSKTKSVSMSVADSELMLSPRVYAISHAFEKVIFTAYLNRRLSTDQELVSDHRFLGVTPVLGAANAK